MDTLASLPTPLSQQTPHTTMWAKIYMDYTHSTHPSHIACTPPVNRTPPPAIRAAAASHSCLISSTIFHFAVAHCFDIDYSDQFHPSTTNATTCPCTSTPCLNLHRTNPRHPKRHTRDHIIFHCPLTAVNCIPYIYTLRTILQSEEYTAK